MKLCALLTTVLVMLSMTGCGVKPVPAAKAERPTQTSSIPPTGGPITYTVEPFDMDGSMGIVMSVTQNQFGGRMCPCVKIPYIADGMHNQQGADAIARAPFRAGDTLMGFSLGVQVISLFLSQHTLPPGVHVLLAGDTFAQNARFNAGGVGIPLNIANDVTMVVNEYDGWSDAPDVTSSPNFSMSNANATAGLQRLHYYANADVNNPANPVEIRGSIRLVVIPTQHLPQNIWLRPWADASADTLDNSQRDKVNSAYSRPVSTAAQRTAARAQQVPHPNPAWVIRPEPTLPS